MYRSLMFYGIALCFLFSLLVLTDARYLPTRSMDDRLARLRELLRDMEVDKQSLSTREAEQKYAFEICEIASQFPVMYEKMGLKCAKFVNMVGGHEPEEEGKGPTSGCKCNKQIIVPMENGLQ